MKFLRTSASLLNVTKEKGTTHYIHIFKPKYLDISTVYHQYPTLKMQCVIAKHSNILTVVFAYQYQFVDEF